MENPKDHRTEQPAGGSGGREPSDRWDFSSVPPAGGDLIPQLKEIPETPEERRRRKIILAISAVIAAIVVVTTVIIVLNIRHDAQISDAVEEYGETGRIGALDRALELLEGDDAPEDRALRARLLATAVLEHGREEAVEPARALIDELADPSLPGISIAETYLALAAGRPTEAQQLASQIAGDPEYPAEASRAQALAAEAIGATPQAAALAAAAVEEMPVAPRHVALLSRLLARTGEYQKAVQKLEDLEGEAAASPLVRLTRARVAMRQGDLATAASQAEKVLGDQEATPVEKAWAQLVLGHVAASRGDARAALKRADEAAEARPVGDEDFVLWRGRTLLLAGATKDAGTELERLPEGVTSAPRVRAQVVAELALAQGNVAAAAGALERAPEGPRTALLRGHVAAARDEPDAARKYYRTAAKGKAVRADAYAALAMLELGEEDPQAAVKAASKALTADPADADAVAAFAEVKKAAGEPKAAMDAVRKALEARPDDGRLLAIRAELEMAADDWKAARATLEKATARLPREADLFAELGEARRQLGETDEATEALERALALDPRHPLALSSLLRIHVDAENLEEAGKILKKIDAARVRSVPVDRARARYLVMKGAGHDGVKQVRRAILKRGMTDSVLWLALGRLQLQAGEPRQAVSSFGRVLRERENDPHALLGRALSQLRMGARGGSERTLDDLKEAMADAEVDDELRATAKAAEARLELLEDRFGPARALARDALEMDPNNAEAHLVLADLADERDRDPTEHLRAALKADIPPPEAKGRLALELEPGEERCRLAGEYREAAPGGLYARSLARVVRACR